MTRLLCVTMVIVGLGVGGAAAQEPPTAAPAPNLPSVRITQGVTANGQPLAPGTYRIRITAERPALPTGEPSENQRWVEFVADGKVVAREIAELLPADPAVGTSTASGASPAVVQLLKEGDYVRISIRRSDGRYLVYLPTGAAPVQP